MIAALSAADVLSLLPLGVALALPAPLPVTLLVAQAGEFEAVALVEEGSRQGDEPDLAWDLAAWREELGGPAKAHSAAVKTRRTLGFRHVRNRLKKLWDARRLLVSCYGTYEWLLTGKRPESGDKDPDTKAVIRGLRRVADRAEGDATDTELLDWLRAEYGPRVRSFAAAAAGGTSDEEALAELRAFFEWFRDRFPYYRGACGNCGAGEDDAHVLGLSRPTPQEQSEGVVFVTELYACKACNCTTHFPRYRTVPPVLQSKRGRCGEYSWTAMRLLEALGYGARWIDNHAGHVWVEARLPSGRWVHVDPCEAAVDQPLLYAQGWGRCPKHVLAYSVEAAAPQGPPAGSGGARSEASELVAAVEDVTASYRPPGEEPVPNVTRAAVAAATQEARAAEEERLLATAGAR